MTVDRDSCYADGVCIEACPEACPVQVFQWNRTEQDVPAVELTNATSAETGEDHREGRKDYTDISGPIESMTVSGVWLAYQFVHRRPLK